MRIEVQGLIARVIGVNLALPITHCSKVAKLQNSSTVLMGYSPFWNVTPCRLVFTDVSGRTIGLIPKGQEVQEES
jgi:hypothetical protein